MGKGLRACAEDAQIAAAFGVNHRRLALVLSGLGAAFAGVAGAFVALIYTLAPAQIYAWIGVVFAAVILGGLGNPLGPLLAGVVIGVTEALTMALDRPRVGPARLLHAAHPRAPAAPGSGVACDALAGPAALAAVGLGLLVLPAARPPAFYESFLYLVFHWVALATSWSILSGYSGYFSFGHGAFFGAGMYATATLATAGLPFLATLPLAGLVAALFGMGMGAVVFRVRRLRGELFALLTLAVTFVLATIVLNTRIDGGPGVYLSAVPLPRILGSPTATLYLLGLAVAVVAVASAYAVHRARWGAGLFAIHDDEDVAEVLGVPTYRYKLRALGLSAGLAGVAGGIHAMFVTYVTVAETFSIVVPLYVVLMSVVGGARHWIGPAIGASLVTVLMYGATGGQTAVAGRAMVGLTLMLVILFLPDGVTRLREAAAIRATDVEPHPVRRPASRPLPERVPRGVGPPLLVCADVRKAFRGVQALGGVSLEVREGRDPRARGPERLRQVDAHQRRQRPLLAQTAGGS